MKKFSFKLVWTALKDSFTGFSNDKVTKLSASLAYYTVFSLAPLLIVIISVCSIFLGREAIEGTIQAQMQSFIGSDAAKQVEDMIKNASISGKGTLATIIGVVTLLIGATTVFGEIQDSVNSIWGLKPRPKVGFMKLVKTRLLSFGMIGTLGFLLLVSLAVTTVVESIGERIQNVFPDVAVIVFYIINLIVTLGITTVMFGFIFKVLPDAKIKWKDIWPGAVATSLLFLIGKFAISFYVSKSEIGSTYGAAGSLVILLVWIYYSSIILYIGAEFTKSYAFKKGAHIVPNEYAEWNNEATVAGAKPKPTHTAAEKKEQTITKQTQVIPSVSTRKRGSVTSKKKSAGLGTILLGLALYYINTSSKKTSNT